MNTEFAWLPAFLQVSDSLFPTGAYAHSLGFEELVRLTDIRNEEGVRDFLHEHILPALETLELPYLRFAFDAPRIAALVALDTEITASKLAKEIRDASTQIGRRRLAALRAVGDHPAYREFAESITSGAAHGNHLTVCALQARVEQFPLEAALSAWAYHSVSGVCSAALKLMRIGQEGCQRALRSALAEISGVIARSLLVAREEAGCFDPLLEIAAMRHEFAEERLFIS